MNDQERLLGLCLEYELGTLEGEERTELESLLRKGDSAARAALSEARARWRRSDLPRMLKSPRLA